MSVLLIILAFFCYRLTFIPWKDWQNSMCTYKKLLIGNKVLLDRCTKIILTENYKIYRWRRAASMCTSPLTTVFGVRKDRYLKPKSIFLLLKYIWWTTKCSAFSSRRSITFEFNDLCKVRNSAGNDAWFIFYCRKTRFKFYISANSILKLRRKRRNYKEYE